MTFLTQSEVATAGDVYTTRSGGDKGNNFSSLPKLPSILTQN
jgi:hypothetical protein